MNKKFKYYLPLFLAFLFLSLSIQGQQIKRLDTNEGLNSGTINKFVKDSLGYVWIGTDKGISRYSGVQFKKYDLETIISEESNAVLHYHLYLRVSPPNPVNLTSCL